MELLTPQKAKIFFFGAAPFSQKILQGLLKEKIRPAVIVTQPNRPSGRGQSLAENSLKTFALENNLPIWQPFSFDEKILSAFENEKPDLFLTAAYGKIIPAQLLEIPRFHSLNVHPSLLPEFRGPAPIQTALLQDKKQTGITIMLMNDKMDEGDILLQKEVFIEKDDCYPQLEEKLAEATMEILPNALEKWIARQITPRPQEKSIASYTQLIKKEDGLINWEDSAQKIYNQHRAFFLWPKVYCFWQKRKIVLTEMTIDAQAENIEPAGKVIRTEKGLAIVANPGLVYPRKIQLEGRKEMTIKNFLNGCPDFVNSQLQ